MVAVYTCTLVLFAIVLVDSILLAICVHFLYYQFVQVNSIKVEI